MDTAPERHRGAHPADHHLFSARRLADLRQATADLSWLLTRGYAPASSLKLVGDRYALKQRQRLAVGRAACSDQHKAQRLESRLSFESMRGEVIVIDGLNLIITMEAALSGGLLIACRDGCIRDLASVHGSYRSVNETEKALLMVGETLALAEPKSVLWLLDQPVSNSGRLAQRIREIAEAAHWPWTVEVVMNPDRQLRHEDRPVITSDSNILDAPVHWINFNAEMVERHFPQAWLLPLQEEIT